MTEAKSTRTVCRGRIFPEIQWTEEQRAKSRAQRSNFHQRSQVVFDRVKPEYMQTHYNWYMVVEPESGNYFIARDEETAMQMARQKHPGVVPLFLFQINETGVSGTI